MIPDSAKDTFVVSSGDAENAEGRTVLADRDDALLELPAVPANCRERLEDLDRLATVDLYSGWLVTVHGRGMRRVRTPRLGSNLGRPGAPFPPVMSCRKLTTSWLVPDSANNQRAFRHVTLTFSI